MKRRARDTNDTTYYVIGDSLETETESTVIKLPKLDSLKRTVRRERQANNAAPAQPESLQDLINPPEYQETTKGENFLLYDPSYLQFGFISSPDELKPVYLTCHVCLANDSMRPHHLKAQQFSKHPTEVGQPIEYYSQKKKVI